MTTGAVGNLVRARFGGKPKVPRPLPKKTLDGNLSLSHGLHCAPSKRSQH
jgi:hypothetical protein